MAGAGSVLVLVLVSARSARNPMAVPDTITASTKHSRNHHRAAELPRPDGDDPARSLITWLPMRQRPTQPRFSMNTVNGLTQTT